MRVITIDGPGGSGKSTVARLLAERLGWAYLDSGAVYRALTAWAMGKGVWEAAPLASLADPKRLVLDGGRVALDGRDLSRAIRTAEVTAEIYRVADLPAVREAVNAFLRNLAARQPVVAEGRDMGTEAFPEAPLKVYLDADPEERARRRGAEGTGETAAALSERVKRDRERKVGGLRPAPDALIVDATDASPAAIVEHLVAAAGEHGLSHG